MSSIPKLTIPESSYDPSSYSQGPRSKSQLLIYLIKLTHGASISLVVTFLVAVFAIKPLLQTASERRLEVLECIRGNLRDLYLKVITKVNYIPITAIRRHGKLYADAIVQTSGDNDEKNQANDALGQTELHLKLKKIATLLHESVRGSYAMDSFMHSKGLSYAIKDFQNKAEMEYFNVDEFFLSDRGMLAPGASLNTKVKKKNLVVETKNEIRSIKGLYMSGQV
ncbi:uncharacterized protein LODBEIA_P36060 [Lodderomyces beijingensis]|uniref:Uncharacterized protein n=1 Tax=Lodderomyces beijingensis TaxID=1775926 RepID=A0ABP0ZPW5_9ASCO